MFVTFQSEGYTFRMNTDTGDTWRLTWGTPPKWQLIEESDGKKPVYWAPARTQVGSQQQAVPQPTNVA